MEPGLRGRFILVYGCWKRVGNYATLCHKLGHGSAIKNCARLLRMSHESKGIRSDRQDFGIRIASFLLGSKVCHDVPRDVHYE